MQDKETRTQHTYHLHTTEGRGCLDAVAVEALRLSSTHFGMWYDYDCRVIPLDLFIPTPRSLTGYQ